MSSQRYERISPHDDEPISPTSPNPTPATPTSPPPSFRSHASSPARPTHSARDPLISDADRALADSFDRNSDDGASDDEDRRRVRWVPGIPSSDTEVEHSRADQEGGRRPFVRRVTELPVFTTPVATPAATLGRMTRSANDGVFANMSAKPEAGEKADDQPPSYEQAAADATPPYWETTILAPGMGTDDVFIDGLPVGSVFSFAWNGLISMSFQIVGFLLTYLLHTTHAAKNGSKAGLGIALVQQGLSMQRAIAKNVGMGEGGAQQQQQAQYAQPSDPNSHDISAITAGDSASAAAAAAAAAMMDAQQDVNTPMQHSTLTALNNNWVAYGLMILGWFILIKSISNYIRVRRHEQLVLQSPDRGLPVPVVAQGEQSETAV